jgi:peptidyl-prolyl cis-trans isomerase A (cyclophilin A)
MQLTALLLLMSAAAVAAPKAAHKPRVQLETSKGTIVIELEPSAAQATVANFLEYVRAGYYDGTIFHRVIPGFMIQGGGLTADMQQKPTRAPIVNESANGLANRRGTIAMARTAAPNSATSQFFINLVDNAFLDRTEARDGVGYCVFGRVVEGMDVVDAIASVPTATKGMYQNVPQVPVTITKATVVPHG